MDFITDLSRTELLISGGLFTILVCVVGYIYDRRH